MPDLSQMVGNISELVPALSLLIQVVAGLLGFIVVAQGLQRFWVASSRGEATIGAGFLYLVSGVALINLAISADVAMDLLFGGTGASVNNLMAYTPSSAMPEEGQLLMKALLLLIQLFGLFFLVTGLLQMRQLSDNRNGSDVSVKGTMFRTFGGAAMLNMVLTVNTVAGILGFGSVL